MAENQAREQRPGDDARRGIEGQSWNAAHLSDRMQGAGPRDTGGRFGRNRIWRDDFGWDVPDWQPRD